MATRLACLQLRRIASAVSAEPLRVRSSLRRHERVEEIFGLYYSHQRSILQNRQCPYFAFAQQSRCVQNRGCGRYGQNLAGHHLSPSQRLPGRTTY